jgi:hypothetical protein
MIIACDSGFLMRLADADDEAWSTYAALLEFDPPLFLIAPPSVAEALDHFSRQTQEPVAALAQRAWHGLQGEWRIRPALLDESQRKLAWIIGYHLRLRRVIPEALRIESEVFAETTLLADVLLLLEDSPLAGLDATALALSTRLLGLHAPVITNPVALRHQLRS